MKLGDYVKAYRQEHGLSQRDLARLAGLTSGYISMLENDRNPRSGEPIAPTARTWEKLAGAMGLSVGELLRASGQDGGAPSAPGSVTVPAPPAAVPLLSPAGTRIGRLYELATDRDKQLVDTVLEPYDDGSLTTAAVLPFPAAEDYFRHRSEDGFDEVDVFEEAAAAGLGNYLGAPVSHTEQYPPGLVPRGTDFGVLISGDSMEPEIRNGSTVFVQARPAIEPGETGIFVLNGQSYCKRLVVDYSRREIRLRSNNPDYADILIGAADELRTLGRVLGSF